MAKTEHTPGPWKLEQLEESRSGYVDWDTFTIRDGKTNGCLAVVGQVDRQFGKANEANARLFAAAPDLLALVRSYRTTYPLDVYADRANVVIAKATT